MQIRNTHIDFDKNQIKGPAGDFFVEPKIMKVLAVLLENSGQVVTRDKLIDEVWGVACGGDERLSRAISILRKSFGDSRGNHTYIQTIPRRGYLLKEQILDRKNENIEPNLESDALDLTNHLPQTSKTLRTKHLIALVSFVIITAVAYFTYSFYSPAKKIPLVIIMDSSYPDRVYDKEVRDDNGTNADILSDILSDLPLQAQKELISPNWNRYEAITKFEPELIMIHYSGFKQADASGARPKLKLLIEYFLNTKTQFLVYSRASEPWLNDKMSAILENLPNSTENLHERIHIFPLNEHGEPHWKDPVPAQLVKLKVKDMLALE